MFERAGDHAFLHRPRLDCTACSDIYFKVDVAVLNGGDVLIVGKLGIVAYGKLKKVQSFHTEYGEVRFLLVAKGYARSHELFSARNVLDELKGLAVPDLHNSLGIEGYDDGVLLRAVHRVERGLVTHKLRHWTVQIGVPDEHIEVEGARDDDFVDFREGETFDSFLVTLKDLAEDQSTLPHLVQPNVGVIAASDQHVDRFDV